MSAPRLSDRLESIASALADSGLTVLASVVVVDPLVDALEHAAVLACEVEHEAARAAVVTGEPTEPAYPPLVWLLGRALEVQP